MKEIHYLLGNSCNLNCDFCFWDLRVTDVSLAFKKRIVDQIIETKIKRVTISGGEPLCAGHFLEILEYMNKNNLEIILHTNGLKIDASLAKRLSTIVSRVSLTFDGANEEAAMKIRKSRDIFQHTIFLIKTFHKLQIPVNVKTLVTKTNQNQMIEIGNILKNLPIQYWSILKFIPLNRGKIHQEKFLISQKDFDGICAKIQEKFPSINIKIRDYSKNKNNYCFIAPNGDVYAYKENNGDILIGNIETEELSAIISKIEK